MAKQKVAMLTAGGLAPCLSSAVGGLIERYSDVAPDIELIAYRSGYQGRRMPWKCPAWTEAWGSPLSALRDGHAKPTPERTEGQARSKNRPRRLCRPGRKVLGRCDQ